MFNAQELHVIAAMAELEVATLGVMEKRGVSVFVAQAQASGIRAKALATAADLERQAAAEAKKAPAQEAP